MTVRPTDDDIHKNIRYAGLVKRYHTWPVLREQNVAEHTWHVIRIYVALFGLPTAEVLLHLLYHDVGEQGGGDMQFGAKRRFPALKAACDEVEQAHLLDLGVYLPMLTDVEHVRFKVADVMEMMEYGAEECAKGNSLAWPVVVNCTEAIVGMMSRLSERDQKSVREAARHVLYPVDTHGLMWRLLAPPEDGAPF